MAETLTRAVGRRKWLIRGLVILVMAPALLLGLYAARQDSAPAPLQAGFLKPFPVTVAPGIHLLGGLAPAAAYVVETSEGLVLIDAGMESDAVPLKKHFAWLNLDWKQVRAILLTHVHVDHIGGAKYLRQETGAKVYAGREDAQVLREGGPREAFFSAFDGFMPHEAIAQPTPVDVELQDGDSIVIGEARFQALATPGHTPGSICYLLELNGRRVLFSGDVIMALAGKPETLDKAMRPLGTYAAYLPPRYRGEAQAFLTTLRRLRAMPVPDLVLPGHPRIDPKPQSPVLSQNRWESLLDAGILEMENELAHRRDHGGNFLDGAAVMLLPYLYYLGDFKGGAVYAFVASGQLVLVNAPGGPGLMDFVTARLAKLGAAPKAPSTIFLTSCDAEATAGLHELVAKTGAQVVAGADGLDKVKELCPPGTIVHSALDLPEKGWVDVTPIPLKAPGLAPVAYSIQFANKTVLFTGDIPILYNSAAAMTRLSKRLAESKVNGIDFAASLNLLRRHQPDLWLPAFPAHGQYANLRDNEWTELLTINGYLANDHLAGASR